MAKCGKESWFLQMRLPMSSLAFLVGVSATSAWGLTSVHGDEPWKAAVALNEPTGADGVMFALATKSAEFATFCWTMSDKPDIYHRYGFSTPPDGIKHVYWLNLKFISGDRHVPQFDWKSSPATGGVYQFLKKRDVAVEGFIWTKGVPDIPSDPAIHSALPEEPIARAGRPFPIEVIVRNYGTHPVTGLRFEVEGLPSGVTCACAAELAPGGLIEPTQGFDTVYAGNKPALRHERRFRVTLTDPGVADFTCRLKLLADGGIERMTPVHVKTLPSLGLPNADYVPMPKPISTKPYRVGAVTFPGWDTHLWHPVWSRDPKRKPLLGWYDETDPEVIDWQIKFLVENGISFLYVDWYWNEGRRIHTHWPKAFAKARYRSYMKWAVHWCNHNRAGAHSIADQEAVTKVWIDEFFGMPEYLTEDGRPVVVIWDQARMESDMKDKGGCRALLEASRRLAREAGYKGIWFVAMRQPDSNYDPAFHHALKDRGFDATCEYRYLGTPRPDIGLKDGHADFRRIMETTPDHLRRLQAVATLPFLPSLSTSFDARVWHFSYTRVTSGYNVERFRRICEDVKRFSDEWGVRTILLGPLDEWGEGSIGYPNAEHGFGILESVRDTFGTEPAEGWPVNCGPADVGLGPYPAPSAHL